MPAAAASVGYGPNGAAKATRWANSACAAGPARGLRALCTRANTRPPRTTQADPQAVAAANKMAAWPAAAAPNQIWVGDITYLALATGPWALGLPGLLARRLFPARGGLARERVAAHGLDANGL